MSVRSKRIAMIRNTQGTERKPVCRILIVKLRRKTAEAFNWIPWPRKWAKGGILWKTIKYLRFRKGWKFIDYHLMNKDWVRRCGLYIHSRPDSQWYQKHVRAHTHRATANMLVRLRTSWSDGVGFKSQQTERPSWDLYMSFASHSRLISRHYDIRVTPEQLSLTIRRCIFWEINNNIMTPYSML
jgi:hypothetical protein